MSGMVVSIFGDDLGTASAWDQLDNLAICFYDFVPNSICSIPAASLLNVEFESGLIEAYNSDNELLFKGRLKFFYEKEETTDG